MPMLGLDPEAVERMAQQFDTQATTLETMVRQLGQLIQSNVNNTWRGNDATRFQGEWDGQLAGQLTNVANQLKETSSRARKNITDQNTASA